MYKYRASAAAAITNVHEKVSLHNRPIVVRYAGASNAPTETKLFVGMLARTTDEQRVTDLFSKYGHVKEVYLMRDTNTVSKGCAFVKMLLKESADLAMADLNDRFHDEGAPRKLVVRYANTKSNKKLIENVQQMAHAAVQAQVSQQHHQHSHYQHVTAQVAAAAQLQASTLAAAQQAVAQHQQQQAQQQVQQAQQAQQVALSQQLLATLAASAAGANQNQLSWQQQQQVQAAAVVAASQTSPTQPQGYIINPYAPSFQPRQRTSQSHPRPVLAMPQSSSVTPQLVSPLGTPNGYNAYQYYSPSEINYPLAHPSFNAFQDTSFESSIGSSSQTSSPLSTPPQQHGSLRPDRGPAGSNLFIYNRKHETTYAHCLGCDR